MFCSIIRLEPRAGYSSGDNAEYDAIPVASFWFDAADVICAPWESWSLEVLEWARNDDENGRFEIVATENVEDDMGWIDENAGSSFGALEAMLKDAVQSGARVDVAAFIEAAQ